MRTGTVLQSLSQQWLNKRIPPNDKHTLDRQNIFIFPGAFGGAFILMTLCLFVLGVNYQNNLLLFLSYLLISLLLVTLFTSYKNVAGLQIKVEPVKPVYAGDTAYLVIKLSLAGNAASQGIVEINVKGSNNVHSLDLNNHQFSYHLPLATQHRGVFDIDRVTFRCSYPLGLFRCWTHLAFQQQMLVYPAPQAGELPLTRKSAKDGHHETTRLGNDDFFALQPWQEGDPLHRIAWKRVAKGGDWASKVFSEQQSESGFLDFSQLNMEPETALRILCWQINTLTEKKVTFGLRIGDVIIPPSTGLPHRAQCLRALALYPQRALS